MKTMLKHLWLAVSLIVAASMILLLSDMEQRQRSAPSTATKHAYPAIAIMQHASTRVLDSHVQGC